MAYTLPTQQQGALLQTLHKYLGQLAFKDQIGTGDIIAQSITAQTIKAGSISGTTITAGSITGTQIAARTITAVKMVLGTLTTNEIAANTITGGNIAANTITATNIAAATITTTQIAANTIVGGNIAANTISVTSLQGEIIRTAPQWLPSTAYGAGAVVVASDGGLSYGNYNAFYNNTGGTFTSGGSEPNWSTAPTYGNLIADGTGTWTNIGTSTTILPSSIHANRIIANSITATQIAAATITTTQIAASTIVGGNIAASTITGGNIAAGTVSATNIAANTITTNQIAANTIQTANMAAGSITAQGGTYSSTTIGIGGTLTAVAGWNATIQASSDLIEVTVTVYGTFANAGAADTVTMAIYDSSTQLYNTTNGLTNLGGGTATSGDFAASASFLTTGFSGSRTYWCYMYITNGSGNGTFAATKTAALCQTMDYRA